MKNLFVLLAVMAFSSVSVAQDQSQPYCNPCWMVEELFKKIEQSKKSTEIIKFYDLIETQFGPACKERKATLAKQAKEQLLQQLKIGGVVLGVCVIVGLAAKVYDNYFGATEKIEDQITEDQENN